MVALFLMVYFLTLVWVWKMRTKLKSDFTKDLAKVSMELHEAQALVTTLEDELKLSTLEKRALKRKAKAKAKSLQDLLKSKEQVVLVLQEQLKITQCDDRELRETNLRLGNQLAEAHSTISDMRDNW